MAEDLKFKWDEEAGVFRNRVSGEAIPKDEPVILFRARDAYALEVLAHYAGLVQDPHHFRAVKRMRDLFNEYRVANPGKIKEPGITHDINLEDD